MTTLGPPPAPLGRPSPCLPNPRLVTKSTDSTNVFGRVAEHHIDLAGAGRDLRCATGTRQADLRMVVVADHRAVQIGEPVDLRRRQEPDVDPTGLEPVGEDLGNRDHQFGGLCQLAIANREGQHVGSGCDGP